MEISGEAVYKGADIGILGASITITGITAAPGAVFLTEMSDKYTNTGFRTQAFKAISVSGINA